MFDQSKEVKVVTIVGDDVQVEVLDSFKDTKSYAQSTIKAGKGNVNSFDGKWVVLTMEEDGRQSLARINEIGTQVYPVGIEDFPIVRCDFDKIATIPTANVSGLRANDIARVYDLIIYNASGAPLLIYSKEYNLYYLNSPSIINFDQLFQLYMILRQLLTEVELMAVEAFGNNLDYNKFNEFIKTDGASAVSSDDESVHANQDFDEEEEEESLSSDTTAGSNTKVYVYVALAIVLFIVLIYLFS